MNTSKAEQRGFKVGQRVRVDFGTGNYVRGGDNHPFFAEVQVVEEGHVWVKRMDVARAKTRRVCMNDCSTTTPTITRMGTHLLQLT